MNYIPKRKKLSRRSFLRGTIAGGAGVAVGLPMLEVMLDSHGVAHAQSMGSGGAPKRYVVTFAGPSLGSNGELPRNLFVPDKTGAGYDLKRSLEPIGQHQVQDHISVVSNLRIPLGDVPGGRIAQFHGGAQGPLLSGVRTRDVSNMTGTTSDQIVAQALAGQTSYDSLTLRVQAASYIAGSSQSGKTTISFVERNGSIDSVPARVDPYQTFQQIFGGFSPPMESSQELAARQLEGRSRGSILDAVARSYEALAGRVSAADRRRMDQHLTEIRELERRVESFQEEMQMEGACMRPVEPMESWPTAGGHSSGSDRNQNFDTALAWSREDERAEIMTDLLYYALVCDLTRVAALQYTYRQSFMSARHLCGRDNDIHAIGHSHGDLEHVADIHKWHVNYYAKLVKKLADAPEGDGAVIDNCAIVYVPEGGHGYNPENGGADNSVHSTENMALLVAGGAGGLAAGQHIRAADNTHPCNVLLSAMTAVGVDNGGKLGEVEGVVPELFA